MAAVSSTTITPSTFLLPSRPSVNRHKLPCKYANYSENNKNSRNRGSFRVQAAKVPAGVVMPKVEPKLKPPFAGFTKTAETWNSRACMIGLIGTFIVELIFNKGILEMIGIEIGKGLDIPL